MALPFMKWTIVFSIYLRLTWNMKEWVSKNVGNSFNSLNLMWLNWPLYEVITAVTQNHTAHQKCDCSFHYLSPLCHPHLGHPLAVLGLQAFLGFLEVGVLVFVGGRLQVVVHSIRGAGRGCGDWVKKKNNTRHEVKDTTSLSFFVWCGLTLEMG